MNFQMGIRNRARTTPTQEQGSIFENKIETLLNKLSENQVQPPLPTLSQSSQMDKWSSWSMGAM